MAIVPDRELRKPILMESPSVSMQLVPPPPVVVSLPTLLPPQALSASVAAAVRQIPERRRRRYARLVVITAHDLSSFGKNSGRWPAMGRN
jgi:hypothetical protein